MCRTLWTPCIKKGFKGTQHKYGKLGTIDIGACFLAPGTPKQWCGSWGSKKVVGN